MTRQAGAPPYLHQGSRASWRWGYSSWHQLEWAALGQHQGFVEALLVGSGAAVGIKKDVPAT
jgi:hypothetical protein